MKIIDNLLEPDVANNIESQLLSVNFPWYYQISTCNSDEHRDINTVECPQFCHGFYYDGTTNSSYWNLVKPIVDKAGFDISSVIRVKANLMYCHPLYLFSSHTMPHIDYPGLKTESLIYYVNDSDGDTFLIEEGHRITPKKNKAIVFDSFKLHAGSPPKEDKVRVVINVVLRKED
jgi:hypothetical protein